MGASACSSSVAARPSQNILSWSFMFIAEGVLRRVRRPYTPVLRAAVSAKAKGRDKQAPSLNRDRRNKKNPAETGATPNAYDTTVILEKQKTPFPSWKKGLSWAHLESKHLHRPSPKLS